MKRYEQLTQWLGDRQRKYADGLTLFNTLAKKVTVEKHGAYLNNAPTSPHIFDPHFTQLVNLLAKIEREIKEAPDLYPAALEEISAQVMKPEVVKAEVNIRLKVVNELKETISCLQLQIEEQEETIAELESDAEDHETEIETLETELEDHKTTLTEKLEELKKLQEEIAMLQKPGVKIITEASLPKGLQANYSRIKEIAPLYASLHAEIANPELPDEKRKELAEELCKLDDERRKLWDTINAWAEGKGELDLKEEQPKFSDNEMVRGVEIARRIERLTENITRSRKSAEKAETEGKKTVLQNANERITKYEAELAELQAEIAKQGEAAN